MTDCDVILERCINHLRALYTLKILNDWGVPTVNSYEVANVCGDKLLTTVHEYDDRIIELHFYGCALIGTPRPVLGQRLEWVSVSQLRKLNFPPADAQLIEHLSSRDY